MKDPTYLFSRNNPPPVRVLFGGRDPPARSDPRAKPVLWILLLSVATVLGSPSAPVKKGFNMLTWMLCGIAVVAVVVWKIIHNAEVDDKERKLAASKVRRF